MDKDSFIPSILKINQVKDIKKTGQFLSIILYIILVILTVGFNNTLLYFTSMNLEIFIELIFLALPFIILFFSYTMLEILYYTYFFGIGYFMLTFSIINEVYTDQLQQLGYGNIDIAIGIIGWILLVILMYLSWKYKRFENILSE